MKDLLYRLSSLHVLAAAAVLTIFSAGLYLLTPHASATSPVADGQHLITVHDGGKDKSFITSASNLSDAFKGAHMVIDSADLVEPNLSTTLSGSNYDVNVYRAQPVTVVDGAVQKRVMSPYRTAKQIVEHADMTLHDEDRTTLSGPTDVMRDGPGLTLKIDRATPFTLVLYGKSVQSYTQAKTVGDMLKEKHITLGKNDTVSLPQATPITTGMQVAIWRNGSQTVTQQEAIAFDTKQIQDADQPVGYKKVQTPGKNGEKMVTYQIVMKNGVEVSRNVIQSVDITQPVQQVETVGAKPTFSGNFAAALTKLRACEAGGNYANKNNPSYRGAYQYGYTTWANYKGYHDPADAPPAVQDERAWQTYQARGWSPWPNCGASLPDTYR